MIRKVVLRMFGKRGLGAAMLLLLMTSAGSPAAREEGVRRGGPRMVNASEWALFRSGQWIQVSRDASGQAVVDLDFDMLVRQMGRRGRVVLDQEGMAAVVHAALGPDVAIEEMRVADLLRGVRRVRVHFQGMRIPLGERALKRLLTHFAGNDWPIEEMPLSALFEEMSGVEVGADGSPGLLDEPTVFALLGRGLGRYQRSDRVRDADYERRRAFKLQYEDAVSAVRKARRDHAGTRDAVERVYEHAYDVLVANEQLDAAPLLDLHLQLDQELERTNLKSMTLAERIANRLEARRRIFGDEITDLLFAREEAIERYEVDRLALDTNPDLSPAQKARRLRARRLALKVELAKQGIYVGFPDESSSQRFWRAPVRRQGTAPDPAVGAAQEEVQQ